MGEEEMERAKKHICVGLLAHVDAGKTTLAESMLYLGGSIRQMGRVDHGDAFLDTFSLERARGITIFSKQAGLTWKDMGITLLDTPGHVDFSAEMERTLQVLDYAVLVISGADGVQGHVQTLWRLLKQYEIPTFLFVNKMDQPGTHREELLKELQSRLNEACVAFGGEQDAETFYENLALCDEHLMEEYLESGTIGRESIAEAVAHRKVFPCYFGAALRLQGVEELLDGLRSYSMKPWYPETFGARVYKIARDASGNRITHLKVTGGTLRVRMLLSNANSGKDARDVWQEKADQLRIYNGGQYRTVEEVPAGGICAVTGLTGTFPGQGLGFEAENAIPLLTPVLTYRMILPPDSDPIVVLGQMRQLEEEEPLLHILWKEATGEIHARVMGEVQIEILKSLIRERFSLEVEFGSGSIVYRETLAEPVVGIGHYEPLRHYAEVHLLMEPGEPGSGLQFACACSEDILDGDRQRLVLTHLEEKVHLGVLTGSPITDIRILLVAGRAHQKHTEGGDFRQATYRAVRNGLRKGKSILLEPVFAFTLEVPTENLGRAMSDIIRMHGSFEIQESFGMHGSFQMPESRGEHSILTGTAPVACMQDYQREVNSYTRGHGRLSCTLKGYEPCHNTLEVMEQRAYDPEADLDNPTGSVFCAHGAGFLVSWDRVEDYAHVDSGIVPEQGEDTAPDGYNPGAIVKDLGANRRSSASAGYITEEEINEIFSRTYGKKAEDTNRFRRYHRPGKSGGGSFTAGAGADGDSRYLNNAAQKQEEYLLVDGYNIIFAWPKLRELAAVNMDSARDKLMDILCNYQGYLGHTLILVFDAYKVKGNPGSVLQYHNIHVVFTKEAETADQYIEKTVHQIAKKYRVTVATSDALEQMIIWGDGASRMSALGLKDAVEKAQQDMRDFLSQK